MKTDVITFSRTGARTEEVLKMVEKTAVYKGLPGRDALHLRLLAEEMMGMVQTITGEKKGEFWIEDENGEYRLHLKVSTLVDSEKREQLLSASSSGKNESSRGLMGKLREMFERGAEESDFFASRELTAGLYDCEPSTPGSWDWSMMQYEDALYTGVMNNDAAAREAWDELEKSVVAHVADEVKVSIRGREVEMTVIKKLSR